MDEYQIRKQQRQKIAVEARRQKAMGLSVKLAVRAADNCYGSYALLDELLDRPHGSMERQQQVLEQLAGPHGRTVCRILAIKAGIDLSTYQKGEPVRYTANTDGD